ncbi:MAG: Na(+)-translocating NADH-quinone reductase subunit A [FCB group bacterium]|nr:Na(+)-translocating NADH-quinone reductase subunit A [FCB group bacterium]
MTDIRIRKGHNIKIAGEPKPEVIAGERPATVALVPVEFRYVKPKLLVKEGDTVQLGAPVFFDKRNPQVRWASPGGGTVTKIQFGPRRVIEKVIITLDREEEIFTVPVYDQDTLSTLDRGRIIETLLAANLWPLIRQRPFNKIANPDDKPKAIFISGLNTAPLTVDLELALEGQERSFQAGLTVLNQLTEGAVHLTISSQCRQPALTGAKNVVLHRISGPHPAGNVGIQIHHIDPINPGDIVWTVTAQQVVILGKLFLTGQYDPTIVVSVGGPSVKSPIHVRTRMGVALATLLSERLKTGDHRIVSGDVLTGHKVDLDGYLRFYDTTVSVIPINKKRPFLGWLRLGSNKTVYTLTRAYAAFKHEQFDFTTLKNGSARALVPIDAWEEVLPMDILPNPLYRSILARDVEEMEKLGILECDEEDFALCTFACPSKINLGRVIREGLDLMEKEI